MLYGDIQKRFIRDHHAYISSYIKTYKKTLIKNYSRGSKRQKEIKNIMKNTAIYHPNLFAHLINQNPDINSNITNIIGGGQDDVNKVVTKLHELFKDASSIGDTKDIKDNIQIILDELSQIESTLKQFENKAEEYMDPTMVINNLDTVSQIVKNFKIKETLGMKLYIPPVTYKSVAFPKGFKTEEITTLQETLTKIHENITKLIVFNTKNDVINEFNKKIFKILINAGDINYIRGKVDVLREDFPTYIGRINDIISTSSTLDEVKNNILNIITPDLTEDKYAEIYDAIMQIKQDINNKNDEIEKGIEKLTLFNDEITTVNDSFEQIYGNEPNSDYNLYAAIKSNFIIKIRNLILIMQHANKELNSDIISNIVEKYRNSPLFKKYEDHTDYSLSFPNMPEIDKYIDQLDTNFYAYYNMVKNTAIDIEYDKIEKCKKDLKLLELYQLYTERYTNVYIKDIVRFIDEYNNDINKSTVDQLNIFMSENYRIIISDLYNTYNDNSTSSKKKYDEITALFNDNLFYKTNKVRQISEVGIDFMYQISTMEKRDMVNYKNEIMTRYPAMVHIQDLYKEIMEQIIKKINAIIKGSGDHIEVKKRIDDIMNKRIDNNDAAANFVSFYNILLDGLDKDRLRNIYLPDHLRLVPQKLFTGIYTEVLTNEIYNDPAGAKNKSIIFGQIFTGIKDKNFDQEDLISLLYKLDVKDIKTLMEKKGGNIKKYNDYKYYQNYQNYQNHQNYQYGGVTKQILIANLSNLLMIYAPIKERYHTMITKSIKMLDKYRKNYNDIYAFIRYLLVIATNQYFINIYIIYKYFNKGIIEFYRRIVGNIIKDLDEADDNVQVRYISIFFNVAIRKIYQFLENISKVMTDSTAIIDVYGMDRKSIFTIDLANNFILLNYMKGIIEAYNQIFQNNITVYSRLNDITPDGIISYRKKVFISDKELLMNTGCSFINMSDPEKNKGTCHISTSKAGPSDPTIMWTNYNRCDFYNNPDPIRKFTKFTEVYDSVNFQENSDISKYMALESRLANGNGICLMTYGYSGTGKTYTLFGNQNKQGLLQSTLANINGLEDVEFRLLELYGIGIPYYFYWIADGKSRFDQINHNIFWYILSLSIDGITMSDTEIIKPTNFDSFMNDANTYIPIPRISVERIFKNFKIFTDSIDDYRTKEKRIRETPNNPASSRSVLIYDFKLHIDGPDGKSTVKFLIIDLPGREEIFQTYIDPYFDKDSIQKILCGIKQNEDMPSKKIKVAKKIGDTYKLVDTQVNETIEKLKMIVACIALNPMALPTVTDSIIINYYNNEMPNDVKTLINKSLFTNITSKDRTLDAMFRVDDKNNKLYSGFSYDNKHNCLDRDTTYNKKIVLEGNGDKTLCAFNAGCKKLWQFFNIAAIYIIFELLRGSHIDVLNTIYNKIIEEYINSAIYKQIESSDRAELLEICTNLERDRFKYAKIKEIIKNTSISDDDLKVALKDLLKYDYILTPMEGIYINENIIGLLKFLSDEFTPTQKRHGLDILIKDKIEQKNITLNEQVILARIWLSAYIIDDNTGSTDYTKYTQDGIIKPSVLEQLYDINNTSYPNSTLYRYIEIDPGIEKHKEYCSLYEWDEKNLILKLEDVYNQRENMRYKYVSGKIFNFEKPLITNILAPYVGTAGVIKDKSIIKDYKIFYLFGNDEDSDKIQYKCQHQINLLENTKSFIDSVVI